MVNFQNDTGFELIRYEKQLVCDYIEENLLVTQCGTKTTTSLTEVYKSNQGKVLFVAL